MMQQIGFFVSKSAKRSAIEALKQQRQKIAFDANVQKRFHVNTPHAIHCLKEYEELTRAIEELANQ